MYQADFPLIEQMYIAKNGLSIFSLESRPIKILIGLVSRLEYFVNYATCHKENHMMFTTYKGIHTKQIGTHNTRTLGHTHTHSQASLSSVLLSRPSLTVDSRRALSWLTARRACFILRASSMMDMVFRVCGSVFGFTC